MSLSAMQAPGSGVSHYGRDHSKHKSQTRLNTHDSKNSLAQHRRSPSPTEYWNKQRTRRDGILNRVYDLNVFIHKGIEKFLDKQAVRDLIIEYEAEDIYIGGVDLFFAQLSEDMHENSFSRNKKKTLLDVVDTFALINTGKAAKPVYSNKSTVNGVPGNKKVAQRKKGGLWTKPRSSLWTSFFSAIRIKLFTVHRREKSARRRESELFSKFP